ncbi:MAG: DsbA family protein [Paracoccaceae bacterium]
MNMGIRHTLTSIACAAVFSVGTHAMAAPLDLDDMSPADRATFQAEIRAYLLENPEVIMEAIQILEERRQVAAQQADEQIVAQHAKALYEDGFSYVTGNPDGDVTIVEFSDYRCGFCKRAHPMMEELVDRDPNVRVIVKEFPILGPDSVTAGKMALAAMDLEPEKFSELNDRLMTHAGNLTEQAAYRIAGDVGYDIAALKTRAASSEIDDRLQRNYQLGQALGVQGTPAFVIGSEVIRGFLPIEDMLAAIQEARVESN